MLSAHPAVLEAVVVGRPDELWGETVHADVILHTGKEAAPGELMGFCADHLAGFKVPRSIRIVDALPRNATGKVLKRLVRDDVASLRTK